MVIAVTEGNNGVPVKSLCGCGTRDARALSIGQSAVNQEAQ